MTERQWFPEVERGQGLIYLCPTFSTPGILSSSEEVTMDLAVPVCRQDALYILS